MNKKLIVSTLLTSSLFTFSANAADIGSLMISGGDFFMAGAGGPITPGAFADMSVDGVTYDGTVPTTPADCATYLPGSIGCFTFGFFGDVAIYTAETDGVHPDAPFPAVTGDITTGVLTLDLSSWTAYWNGTSFNQGTGGSLEVSTFDANTGDFTATWEALVVGGAFDGQIGSWTLTGNAQAAAATPPVFTSDPPTEVAENVTGTIYTAVADDADGDTVTYSLSGADAALFDLVGGVLSFKAGSEPDFENPTDANVDNTYDVTITATDDSTSTLSTDQVLAIAVTDVNEFSPVFTSGTSISMDENLTATGYTAVATDADTSQTVTYSFGGGADDALFNLDLNSGVLSFKVGSEPDFEIPTDAGGDNVYNVTITATDDGTDPGTNSTNQNVTVTVLDVEPEVLVFLSGTTANFAENDVGTVYTAFADGPNGANTQYTKNGGADAALFNLDANTGELTFAAPPDFDMPLDAGGDNIYNITINADDDSTDPAVDLDLVVTVTDVNDLPPEFISDATSSVFENQTATGYTADSTDGDSVGSAVTYSINGGDDAALFDIAAGVLSFKVAPDFEIPGDVGGDNDYNVNIDAFDGANTVTQSVTITVLDAEPSPPVITLTGSAEVTINPDVTYADEGATAVDDIDGDISANIVTVNPVPDPTISGIYTITYNVSDEEGDAAIEVTRQVTVSSAPSIFIDGASFINLNVGDSYTDAGATATDAEDGVITSFIMVDGMVDTSVAATYTVTYSVSDSDSNEAIAVRTVKVQGAAGTVLGVNTMTVTGGDFNMAGASGIITSGDITPIVLGTYQGEAPADIGTEESYKPTSLATFGFGDFGPVAVYTADTDGINTGLALPSGVVDTVNSTITLTIPSWIAYWNGSSFAQGPTDENNLPTNAVGIYNTSTDAYDVSWDALVIGGAFDGQIGKWHMTGFAELLSVDSVAPEIILLGDSQIRIQKGTDYIEPGVLTAIDDVDGLLDPASVNISGGVDVNTVGIYTITYTIADSSSNVGVITRQVYVVDGDPPVITLLGDAVVDVAWNGIYIDDGATAADNQDGDLTANITVAGQTIDTSVLGTNFVTYNVSDSDGNPAFEVTRVVNVVDEVAPVITLIGDSSIFLKAGDEYDDDGATATDDVDSDTGVTNSIVTDNPVDVFVEGTYLVTYDVTDAAGNVAETVTRTVFVDFTAPEVTITGSGSLAINIGDEYVDEGATANDSVSGDLVVTSDDCVDVDTSVAGSYTCSYTAIDDAGNETVVTRTVTVLDNTFVIENTPLDLTFTQNTVVTSIAITTDGNVVVTTSLPTDGSDTDGSDTYDWSATDNNLVPVDELTDTAAFTFDPSALADGVYALTVTTNAGTDDEVTTSRLILVASLAPELAAVDTDGDGINDDEEGIGDDDADGVPNYLDHAADPVNQVPVVDGMSMVSNVGTLRLGTTAFSSSDVATGDFSPLIELDDIVNHGGNGGTAAPANTDDPAATETCAGGCFDFEVADLEPGSSVQIVLPLIEAITDTTAYRKYTPEFGWRDFDVSGNDEIASSATVNGTCPVPNTVDTWIDGLFPGDVCIRLTIQDGGVNDADGVANGVVKDPSGASTLPAPAEPSRDFSSNGCSATDKPVNPLDRGDWLLVAGFIAWMGMLTYRRRKSLTRT